MQTEALTAQDKSVLTRAFLTDKAVRSVVYVRAHQKWLVTLCQAVHPCTECYTKREIETTEFRTSLFAYLLPRAL